MYIHVKVTAGSRTESLKMKTSDHFLVSVREKAERNMANTRVCALVADHFGVSVRHVRIVNGHHSPSKLIAVERDD